MNPCYRPGITTLSHTRVVTSQYTFPALEASPFILGAIAITMWEALQPGPDRFEGVADCMWLIPPMVMMQLAIGYACCYIIGIILGALGFKIIFAMASYVLPYDPTSRIPTANWTFRTACVFLVLAYMIVLLGIGILVSRPLVKDRKRLRMLEELDG
ncbi:hypothetical protein DL95DRAFT_395099 [Leptodontidium sp. 2 PMI_412]|nr:hypothetical protein DL95DRAFT_395099 [Leptodontidium sp. 2 PMI_412]